MHIKRTSSTLTITRYQSTGSAARFADTVKDCTAEARELGFSTAKVSVSKFDGPRGKVERRIYIK